MIVCFCLNNLGSLGLGATLTSLIKNCSDTAQLELYFLCSSVNKKIKTAIINLLQELNHQGKYYFIDFDPHKEFRNYNALQNDWTPYGRLLIADHIPAQQVLYLDTDLIIEIDILNLSGINTGDKVVGAIAGSDMRYNLERVFFTKKLGLNPETKSFNSGVLMMNIKAWKNQFIKEKLLTLADQHPNELLAADQTLLNGFFAGNFYHLPSNYNVLWYASSKPNVKENAIYHFVGSPKPWDLFGRQLHSGYKKWKQYSTAVWQQDILQNFKAEQLKRWWHIRRSYLKLLLNK